MRSKKQQFVLLIVLFSIFGLIGCGDPYLDIEGDENNIGSKLTTVTSLKSTDGSENGTIAMFDDVLRKIHQFDVVNMKKLRTLKVNNKEQNHFVLHDSSSNYIIDLTTKGFTVFTSTNEAQNDPIKMPGEPKSAAFSPTLGYLIIYDKLMNVGFVKLAPNGKVISAAVMGSLVGTNSIVAGDLMEDGTLVLSLSDNSLAKVNIDNTISTGTWTYTKVSTAFTNLNWVAPISGNSQRAFVKHSSGVAIINLNNGATVAQVDTTDYFRKLSKQVSAHVVTSKNNELTMIYASGDSLLTRKLYGRSDKIMSSQLDLTSDIWTLITCDMYYVIDPFDLSLNTRKTNRSMGQWKVSNMLSSGETVLPDKAQILLGLDYIFALFPSDLGYAYKQMNDSSEKQVIKGFNIPSFDD